MATLFGKNCAANSGLLGMEPCYVEPGPLLGHILVKGRLTWDVATTTPNKAFFNDLVQQGKAIFLVDAFSAPTEVPAATLETSDITLRSVVVNRGLPMTTTTFKKPYEWAKEAYKLSSQDQDSIFEVYQNVIKVCVSIDKLTFGGFNVGMYEVGTYEAATGSTKAQIKVMYQITDLDGYASRGGYLYGLDFNPNTEINNITGVNMVGRADVSEAGVYVKPTWIGNDLSTILGFATANFRLLIDGVADTITTTAYNSTTKEYKLTPTTTLTTSQEVQVILYDATASPAVAVAKLGTTNPKFYLGETGIIEPVA